MTAPAPSRPRTTPRSQAFGRTVGLGFVMLALSACGDTATEPAATEWSAWSAPIALTGVNSTSTDNQPVLSPDQLSLYFASGRPGGLGGNDIWVSRRASLTSEWQAPVNLGAPINSASDDQAPGFSRTGHLLFFQSTRPGGYGLQDVYVARRSNLSDDRGWDAPVNVGPDLNSAVYEAGPMYLQVGGAPLQLYFARGPRPADVEMWTVPIDADGIARGTAQPLVELNFPDSLGTDARSTVSRDGLELFYFSDRPGGLGLADLYVSTRPDVTSRWRPPVNLGPPLNTEFRDAQPQLSSDDATLVFSSARPGGQGATDIYYSTRTRVPVK